MANRRGNGEGSITLLKDGRWQARVSLPNGKRPAVYGKTKTECLQKLKALLRQVEENPEIDTGITVKQYLERWLKHRALEVKLKTHSEDRDQCQHRLIPKLGKIKLSKLNVLHVQDMLNEVATEVSPSNANRARKVLRNALG